MSPVCPFLHTLGRLSDGVRVNVMYRIWCLNAILTRRTVPSHMVAEVDQYPVEIRTRVLTNRSKCCERVNFAFGFFLYRGRQ